jgi:hypothetical protein
MLNFSRVVGLACAFVLMTSATVASRRLPNSSGDARGTAPLRLSGKINGALVELQFQPWFAGAVSGLQFRGKRYVNTADHGRLIQSAVSFDGWGECLNPTEAGSVSDGRQRKTTSVLLAAEVNGYTARLRTRMAYWMPPGAAHLVNTKDLGVRKTPQPCRVDETEQAITTAINKTAVSDVVLDKRISLGSPLPNVVRFDIGYEIPRRHKAATFEVLTAYLEPDFDHFLELDPKTGTLLPFKSQRSGRRPLVAATRDGRHAVAFVAPNNDLLLGAFAWPDTSKLNCFIAKAPVQAGKHEFTCSIIVGTVGEVKSSLMKLTAGRN